MGQVVLPQLLYPSLTSLLPPKNPGKRETAAVQNQGHTVQEA